jgi:hypothetical protein
LAWLPQLMAGDPGNITATIDWDETNVEPQTCQVCHDPHNPGDTSGEPNNATVRVDGDTPMLPSGFQANGLGRGAMCATCHNTRNDTHNDTITSLADDRAPHTAAQTDVLMGENAYFVTPSQRAGHSFITDTCANCHMERTDPPEELSYNLGGTNHTFRASTEICADCHGTYDGGSLTAVVGAAMHDLQTSIEASTLAHIQALAGAGETILVTGSHNEDETVSYPDFTIDSTNVGTITGLALVEVHGRSGMILSMGGTDYYFRSNSDTNVSGTGNGLFQFNANGQLLAKACWNFWLVEGDGSHGIHNPSWVIDVINATQGALP